MKVTCEVIKDLLPSYTDEICSNDTKELVEKHIVSCESCNLLLDKMKHPISQLAVSNEEKLKSIKPLKKIKKKNQIKIVISVIIAVLVTITCMFIVQNVGVINKFFFPAESTLVNSEAGEWRTISIGSNPFLLYDTIFFDKKVTNDANSIGTVTIRILDEEENIIIDNISIDAGETANLNKLKNNTNYTVECWMEIGWYKLNFY